MTFRALTKLISPNEMWSFGGTMRLMLLSFLSIVTFSSAKADEITFEEFPSHILKCSHVIEDESEQRYERTVESDFEYGGDSYFAYSNSRITIPGGQLQSHVSFQFFAPSKTYKYYFATRSYALNGTLIEGNEETVVFPENKTVVHTYRSKKFDRKFSVSCLVVKP